MRTQLILFAFFILISPISILAQKAFPVEHNKFEKEFSSYLNYSGEIRVDGKSIEKEFKTFWESDSLLPEYKNEFINAATKMRMKSCSAYPSFVYYAANIMAFTRKGIPWDQYMLYENQLLKIVNQKRLKANDLNELLTFTYNLVAKNIVFSSSRAVWTINTEDYSFMDEDGMVVVHFNKTDLCGFYGNDSVKIFDTQGILNPERSSWQGKNGTINWERVGISQDTVYAQLRNYSIDLRDVNYVADSAIFINSIYFDKPLLGQISDNAVNLDDPSKSSYPRFRSYLQHFEIEDLVKGIDYEGGFSMRGKDFIGSGDENSPARLTITKNDTVSMDAYSESFKLDNNFIFSENTEIVLRLSKDSIYHPNLTFKYTIALGELELVRTKEGMSKVNFTNSYHKINMDFTWLKWVIDKYTIEMTMIQTPGYPNEVFFESVDYYRSERYKQIQMHDQQNPLEILIGFVATWGSPEFYASDLAAYMKFSPTQVKQMLLRVAYQGFILYNPEKEYAKVKPEVWDFIDAHRGLRDSDVIQFISKTPSQYTNAELSLLNYDIKLEGVSNVHLSDSQSVSIYPIDQKLILKKNRTFLFNGTVQAGQFYYYGSAFKFDYENFMIDLNQCDSMKMVAETDTYDALGKKKLAIVQNMIENINGEFYIDDPQNKAGRKNLEEYPKFVSKRKSYVYYDNKKIYNKVYDRSRFYFEINPFTIDSINGYSRDNLKFDGTLVSADIFPEIKQTLVLRDDFSLGFQMKTDHQGLPIYQGRATYHNLIDLSNEGLRGKGSLDYITSVASTDYLIFFPDSLQGHAERFVISKQKSPIEYPSVSGVDNDINWSVYEDKFLVYPDTTDFEMFDGQAFHSGYLNLTSKGLEGAGEMTIQQSVIQSNQFKFKQDIIDADTSNFNLYTESKLNVDFKSGNVNSHIDFVERKGVFRSNGEQTSWEFPKNKYISIMDELTWFMDKSELEISASDNVLAKYEREKDKLSPAELEELFLAGPKFISVHPGQDSLSFVAPKARYNYVDYIIYAEGVSFIRVADATVYTSDGFVTIEKDAVMRPLLKSKIIANLTTRYHTIYDASVTIFGKKKYEGTGYYDYIDVAGRKQRLFFDEIGVDRTNQTIASGRITEPDNFKISPDYKFQGKVNLEASREYLEFKGAAAIKTECDSVKSEWVKFSAVINPNDIYIPIDSLARDINNQLLFTGLYLNRNKLQTYFLSKIYNVEQSPVFSAHGEMYYDTDEKLYMIGKRDKLEETNLPGNYIELNNNTCEFYGEGRFTLSDKFGRFNPNVIGYFEYNPVTDTVNMFVNMLISTYFSNQAWKRMSEVLNSTPGLMGIDLGDKNYQKSLVEYLGTQKADEWFSQLSLGNQSKYPKELSDLFILTDIHLQWHPYQNCYLYYGPIGIANAGKYQINKYVYGYILVEVSRRAVQFDILLEADSETYFYFKYSGGLFQAYSSDEEFNTILYETKDGARYQKAEGDLPAMSYTFSSESMMTRMKRELKRKFGLELDVSEDEE